MVKMMRTLMWNIVISALLFWVVMTVVNTGGLSLAGFKDTAFQTLAFTMIYAAVRVAMIIFKRDKK